MGAISDIIASAAQRYGVDPKALTGVAQIESSLNPAARNPRSSAGGLFQFIDSTAGRYGLANKFDPAASADAGARLMRDNASFLQGRLGRAPTPGELYLAHQQGAGGAAKILAAPDASAAATVGQRAFGLNGGIPGMTNAQFAGLWTNKLDKAMGNPVADTSRAPTGTLADALPGATLPTGAVAIPIATTNPVATAAADVGQQFRDRQAADQQAEMARRTALFGGGIGRLYG